MPADPLRCQDMNPTQTPDGGVLTTMLIGGMSCGACVRHVERAFDGISGVIHVEVDLAHNRAVIEHLPSYVDAGALAAAIRDTGYRARVIQSVDEAADRTTMPPSARACCGCGCG
jgi:copper chaperone CopZ